MADKKLTPAEQAAKDKADAEKAKKFKELATRRTSNAVQAIERLEPLANKSAYVFTDEQAAKIVTALEAATAAVKDRFAGKAKVANGFTL